MVWPMSKKVRTHVCFLLDETASMLGRKQETIQGFNGYLEDLKKDKGDEVLFTFTAFNKGAIRTPYKSTPVKNVEPLTDATYNPQNWTPLYDAIGSTIIAVEETIKENDLVIFTILTDGEENSSKEYTNEAIKALIKKYEGKNWKFTFLGVGIDAFAGASKVGLSQASSYTVDPSKVGFMYNCASEGTSALRGFNAANNIGAMASMTSTIGESARSKLASSKNDA